MKVGDLVKVKTKHYGVKTGVVAKIDDDGIHIIPNDHPRNIIASKQDVTWFKTIQAAISNMQLI